MIVSFNGSDNSGKTTQVGLVSIALKNRGLKVITAPSVRHFITGMPENDKEIDTFFKSLSPEKGFSLMRDGYLRRFESILQNVTQNDIVLLDRGAFNVKADLMTNFYPILSLRESYNKVINNTPAELYSNDDLVFLFLIDEPTYIGRLGKESEGFTNIEFQRKLWEIFGYVKGHDRNVIELDASKDRKQMTDTIVQTITG